LLSAAALVNAATAAVYTTQVVLGDAGNYVILAETGIAGGANSVIKGDIALWSPTITSTAITGLTP
jgi:hypothetical protein